VKETGLKSKEERRAAAKSSSDLGEFERYDSGGRATAKLVREFCFCGTV